MAPRVLDANMVGMKRFEKSDEDLFAGLVVNGRYAVVRSLGRGGLSRVFEARDLACGKRACALKVLDLKAPGTLVRFEFECLARIENRNLVKVYELGVVETLNNDRGSIHEGAAFLTEELIEGFSSDVWAQKLKGEDKAQAVALLGARVAGALSALHESGLLHRDVTPKNILVPGDGSEVKLIDLGLARRAGMLEPARLSGTPAFLAPERFEGRGGPAADIYGLGMTLACLVAGKIPDGSPLNLMDFLEGQPDSLKTVIGRMCRARPDHRIASARECALLLEKLCDGSGSGVEVTMTTEDGAGVKGPEPASAEFIGRALQLEALESAWTRFSKEQSSGDVRGFFVVGPAGVGKTRLCRYMVARTQLRPRPPGAPPVQAVRADARTLLDHWAEGRTERSGRALVVLENAHDADADLLFSWPEFEKESCFFVVEHRDVGLASRWAARLGFDVLEVPALTPEEEGKLLEQLLGPGACSKENLTAVRRLSGGLPSLTILAARLVSDPFAKWFRDDSQAGCDGDDKKLERLGRAFRQSLSDLDTKLLEAVAVLGSEGSVERIDALVKAESRLPSVARLFALESKGRLERVGEERFALPGLVARALLASMDPQRLRALHGRAYELSTDPCERFLHADGMEDVQAIVASYRAAVDERLGRDDLDGAIGVLERVCRIDATFATSDDALLYARLLRRSGRYEEALGLLEERLRGLGGVDERGGLERARALRLVGRCEEAEALLDDLRQDAQAGTALWASTLYARCAFDRGDLEEAAARLKAVPAEPDTALSSSGIWSNAGLLALALGETDRASQLFETGLQAASAAHDRREKARYSSLCGMALHRRGDFEKAASMYSRAAKWAREASDRHGGATYLVNLASAYTELDALGDALASFDEGLALLRVYGRDAELAQAEANRAELSYRLGDLSDALERSGRAAKIIACGGCPSGVMASVDCIYGEVLVALGRLEEAEAVLEEAAKEAARARDRALEAACARHTAELFLAKNDLAQARGAIEKAKESEEEEEGQKLACRVERARISARIEGSSGSPAASKAVRDLLALLEELGVSGKTSKYLRAWVDGARQALRCGMTGDGERAARGALSVLESMRARIPSRYGAGLLELIDEMSALSDRAEAPDEAQWRQLLRIIARMSTEPRVERLLEVIMDSAVDFSGAERGFLLIAREDERLEIRCARNLDRAAVEGEALGYSRTVALRAVRTGRRVVTTNAQQDERFSSTRSVLDLDLRFIVAYPLNVRGETVGAIYLDSREPRGFDERSVSLVGALADHAAIALLNARLSQANAENLSRIEKLNAQLVERLDDRQRRLERVESELARRTEALTSIHRCGDLVARSKSMKRVFRLVERFASTDLPVVILGESGTGKELVARAVHYGGARAKGPFVAENCAAIPETLLESILFGHVRGAFTGATRDNPGLFVQADGGTLLLDEISELPLAMQAKLLRVLQDGIVRPVGSTKSTKVDVRVLVATNEKLDALVEAGGFRRDLFYRLDVVRVELPPLRRRTEDIPLLIEHLAKKHGSKAGLAVSPGVLARIMELRWPGNVRQLENLVMRGVALGGRIDETMLEREAATPGKDPVAGLDNLSLSQRVEALKRALIRESLEQSEGNVSKAARLLGVSRYGLQKMLVRFGQRP